jgi:hypothetical protein
MRSKVLEMLIMAAISAKFALRWCLDHLMGGWVGRFIITFPVWVADIIMAAISSNFTQMVSLSSHFPLWLPGIIVAVISPKFDLRLWSYHLISFTGC